jgi:predicted Zn-dependent protease
MAHIDKLHVLRTVKHARRGKWVTFGINQSVGVGLAFVPGAGTVPGLGVVAPHAVNALNSVTAHIVQKGYRRSFEYEADEAAVLLMIRAGYKPRDAVCAMEIIGRISRDCRSAHGVVFATHPAVERRLARLRVFV